MLIPSSTPSSSATSSATLRRAHCTEMNTTPHLAITLAEDPVSQALSADRCNSQKRELFCHLKGQDGSGRDLLTAGAEAEVVMRHWDQDWESKGWDKHTKL